MPQTPIQLHTFTNCQDYVFISNFAQLLHITKAMTYLTQYSRYLPSEAHAKINYHLAQAQLAIQGV
jgi:hypothetical protein